MSVSVCGKTAAHVEIVRERMGGLDEGGWNERSWVWEAERNWEAGRKLKRVKQDRHKKVNKNILVNKSRKGTGK